MSRGRTIIRTFVLAFATASLVLASCIFSPPPDDKGGKEPIPPATSSEQLIEYLSDAYQNRDFALFSSIISQDPTAPYLFKLNEANDDGETEWDATTELRIHKRMFEPQSIDPGDTQLPPDLWLTSVNIQLPQQTDFLERTDLYRTTPDGPGLDPARWTAREAIYETHLLFELVGNTDYRVDGEASFVVIEDKAKQVGDAGKFLLYIWEDLQAPPKPSA
jgi:hypothetical protein